MKSFENLSVKAVILCAGKGARTGLEFNKIFFAVGRKTVLETTLDRFLSAGVKDIILVIAQHDEQAVLEIVADNYEVNICYGGETRGDSVKNGLIFAENCDIAIIHDCARPFVSPELIRKCIDSAAEFGSGIAATATSDTIKKVRDGIILEDIPRDGLYNIQTPQAFRYEEIIDAYLKCRGSYTDDSEIYLLSGRQPRIVVGDSSNKKLTTQTDLFDLNPELRVGTGFDVHSMRPGRSLIIGGVNIPHYLGLDGHSDADVLLHALMDSLLSAAGLQDIGCQFPDTSADFKDMSSLILLERVSKLVAGYSINNISCVIIAQKPKLNPYIARMKENIAGALKISTDKIGITATTSEFLGITGEEKGIAASAVSLIADLHIKNRK